MMPRQWVLQLCFLSCLRGSELFVVTDAPALVFLSCLRGSELTNSENLFRYDFLSCLRGSEHIYVYKP